MHVLLVIAYNRLIKFRPINMHPAEANQMSLLLVYLNWLARLIFPSTLFSGKEFSHSTAKDGRDCSGLWGAVA